MHCIDGSRANVGDIVVVLLVHDDLLLQRSTTKYGIITEYNTKTNEYRVHPVFYHRDKGVYNNADKMFHCNETPSKRISNGKLFYLDKDGKLHTKGEKEYYYCLWNGCPLKRKIK